MVLFFLEDGSIKIIVYLSEARLSFLPVKTGPFFHVFSTLEQVSIHGHQRPILRKWQDL